MTKSELLQSGSVAILASSALVIVAKNSSLGERLTILLRKAGLKEMCVVPLDRLATHLIDPQYVSPKRLLVWLGLGFEDGQDLQQVELFCETASLPWLRTNFDDQQGRADVGPVFPICYSCFADIHLRSQTSILDAEHVRSDVQFTSSQINLWLAIVALRVIRHFTASDDMVPEAIMRYSLPDWRAIKLYATCLCNCIGKSGQTREFRHSGATNSHEAIWLERYLAISTREPQASAIGLRSKPFPTLSRHVRFANSTLLPLKTSEVHLRGDVHALLCGAASDVRLPFSKNSLGLLLQMAAGRRKRARSDASLRRWAASAGNLGSVELFLLNLNTPDVTPGLYHYQATGNTLAHIEFRRPGTDMKQLFSELLCDEKNVDAIVLFTASFARLAKKYNYFGYKLSQLDAGVAASQLQLVAQALGVRSAFAPAWPDDRIADLCQLTESDEHVTGLMTLSWLSEAEHQSFRPVLPQRIEHKLQRHELSGLSLEELYELVYESSRMPLSQFSRCKQRAGCVLKKNAEVAKLSTTTRDLPTTLFKRRSSRAFSSDSIEIGTLSTLLYTSATSDIYEEHDRVSPDLTLYIAAKRVRGLDPAIYKFDSSSHTLQQVGSLPSSVDEKQMFKGEDYTTSAAFLWIAGNLDHACDLEGSFGHRKLLVRAGAFANRILLCAIASHLDGALIAGLEDASLSSSFGFKPRGEISFIAVVLGKPTYAE